MKQNNQTWSERVRQKLTLKTRLENGVIEKGEKIGRNDPCPCGSGKKNKNCHATTHYKKIIEDATNPET